MIKKILLVIVLMFVALVVVRGVQRFANFAKDQVQEELSMGVVSGTNYSFYYPKDWKKGSEEGAELAYFAVDEKGEQTGEGITLEISKSNSKLDPASEELCGVLAKGMATINPSLQGKVMSVVVSNTHPTFQGCKIINSFVAAGIPTTSEVKAIWYKDGRDNTIYVSNANYFDNTSQEVIKTIKNSVNTFAIN